MLLLRRLAKESHSVLLEFLTMIFMYFGFPLTVESCVIESSSDTIQFLIRTFIRVIPRVVSSISCLVLVTDVGVFPILYVSKLLLFD